MVLPVATLGITVFTGYTFGKMLGVTCVALGLVATFGSHMVSSALGGISDNAHALAVLAEAKLNKQCFKSTRTLHDASTISSSMSRAFSLASSALVGLAGFCAFCVRSDIHLTQVSLLEPNCFLGIMFGVLMPAHMSG